MKDLLKKYLFADHSLRIQTVCLYDTWSTALAHQQYPASVQNLLGELSAAAVLLASNLKFDGSLILQMQGNGAISLIVVECDNLLRVRATAKLRQEFAIADNANLNTLLNADGQGRFVVILDLKNRQPGQQAYQGIVPLTGDNVAQTLEHYMKTSEQLDTRLCLASNNDKATGLLLQKLPSSGGHEVPAQQTEQSWGKAINFVATVTAKEQLEVDADTLVHRLFWQDSLILSEAPQPVHWHCTCSRERVVNMLRNLGQKEVESIIAEHNKVHIECDFCGKPYDFDPIQCAEIFVAPEKLSPQQNNTNH